jgi:peptidoglycan-associated lipoprotein
MAMTRTQSLFAATSIFALLSACADVPVYNREPGTAPEFATFGAATENNTQIHSGEKDYLVSLAERFAAEVPDTVNFEFNSAVLDAQAREILARQANWIRQFPEVHFRVYGHTDLVGSTAYNKSLGMRRAQAVVAFLVSQGVSRSRLEAVVSYGETRPVVNTQDRERRNRRTVTEVRGFVQNAPMVLNGKYAEIVMREYIEGATWEARSNGISDQGGQGGGN